MSFVDDFEGIAKAVQALKPDPFKPSDRLMETVEKYGEYAFKSPVVADPNPPEYSDLPSVEAIYGYAGLATSFDEYQSPFGTEPVAPIVYYPHGYREAFEALERARKRKEP